MWSIVSSVFGGGGAPADADEQEIHELLVAAGVPSSSSSAAAAHGGQPQLAVTGMGPRPPSPAQREQRAAAAAPAASSSSSSAAVAGAGAGAGSGATGGSGKGSTRPSVMRSHVRVPTDERDADDDLETAAIPASPVAAKRAAAGADARSMRAALAEHEQKQQQHHNQPLPPQRAADGSRLAAGRPTGTSTVDWARAREAQAQASAVLQDEVLEDMAESLARLAGHSRGIQTTLQTHAALIEENQTGMDAVRAQIDVSEAKFEALLRRRGFPRYKIIAALSGIAFLLLLLIVYT